MGWNNPPVRWADLERALSGRPGSRNRDGEHPGDGGDSPGWTPPPGSYEAPPPLLPTAQSFETQLSQTQQHTRYSELHCHSNFSFLDGASHPEELVEEAARLGLVALALTDHDGFYGVVRFAEAARALGLPTVFGAELTLPEGAAATPPAARSGPADPPGEHLVVLARDPSGYARLARAISEA